MNSVPISVLIPTLNEASNIEGCLRSLAFAAEIVVVDSGSADGTAATAKKFGASVIDFRWNGCYPKKKNWALDNVPWSYEWVLIVDADERVTPELAREIAEVVRAPANEGYYINRRFHFMGGWIRHCGYYPSWNLRLFRHSQGRYEIPPCPAETGSGDNEVHEHVTLKGTAGRLSGELEHYAFPTIASFVEKHNRYSSWEAATWGATGASGHLDFALLRAKRRWKTLARRSPFSPSLRFLYHYFFRLGFLDGYRGWVLCRLLGYYEFLSVTKEREARLRSSEAKG